jgi:hypothetical protein
VRHRARHHVPRVRTLHDPVRGELSQAHLLDQLHAAGMASQAGWLTFRAQCQMLNMTDKPAPITPRCPRAALTEWPGWQCHSRGKGLGNAGMGYVVRAIHVDATGSFRAEKDTRREALDEGFLVMVTGPDGETVDETEDK